MFCKNCGNKVDENAYICVKCGMVLDKKKSVNNSVSINYNAIGIVSIVIGILSCVFSISCFFNDISGVGMYTLLYEKVIYAVDFLLLPGILAISSLFFSLVNRDNKYNRIGLWLTFISLFFLLTEFVVVIIY